MKDKFSSLIRCNIKINTYDRVTVVLTTDGQAVLQKRKARIKKLKISYDEKNNELTCFLWQLLYIFGDYCCLGNKSLFENNEIKIGG